MSKKTIMSQKQLLNIIYSSDEFKRYGTSISRGIISGIEGMPSSNSIIKILGTTNRFLIKSILELNKPTMKQEIVMFPREQWIMY
ncbi:MAG TPA: hypothetical protein VIM70_08220 [Clostridium sp.]|uniref:hypothetical protein n=1 Tax=Clostridium sp. TaxID=1506 RepID=UPI002F95E716